ncbi:MAG: IS4 family transposase [Pyrinomonadaceae bacterium]|nr:IS4 family transposase [Sphingobacteriaceae bacterium]
MGKAQLKFSLEKGLYEHALILRDQSPLIPLFKLIITKKLFFEIKVLITCVMQVNLKHEIENLNLGDKRRDTRIVKIINQLVSKPGSSIVENGESWSDVKMTYRFYNKDTVKESAIADCIFKATLERCKGSEVVLSIQDTTSINFASSAEGLGYLDHGQGEGLMVHNNLVVDQRGCPLGLIDQKIWARDKAEMGKAETRGQRSIEQKESYRWIESMQQSEALLKDCCKKIVHIADREADIYELISAPRAPQSELLIRATHNRKTLLDNNMWDEIEQEPIIARFEVEIGNCKSQTTRIATMIVKAGMVLVSPPPKKKHLPAMLLNGIIVREENNANKEEPIEWRLITTMAVNSTEDVLQIVKWYSFRWRIERLHFILKSGCRLEDLQLRNVKALRKATLIYSLCAFKLMQLLYLARQQPDEPCTSYLEDKEWKTLMKITTKLPYTIAKPPTLQQAVVMLARLGGFLARKNDGPPGIKNLWRGMQKLHVILNALDYVY